MDKEIDSEQIKEKAALTFRDIKAGWRGIQ